MTTEGVFEHIRLFRHVAPATRAAMRAASEVVQISPGQVLFKQGDPGEYLLVVLRGSLEAFVELEGGHRVRLRSLGPGQVAGLTSIALGCPRSATVQAAGQAVVGLKEIQSV